MVGVRFYRRLIVAVGTLLLSAAMAPSASAAIIKIDNVQTCAIQGLDSSPATAQGGVHCLVNLSGTTNDQAFSLTALLDGSIALYVGNSQTPSWNFINDTGAYLSSLSVYYSGALASNSSIDMQEGGDIFSVCTAKTATNVVTSDAHCGSGDVTADNPALPLLMTWSVGAGDSGLPINQLFSIRTASFAHAGLDAGCISGTPNCQRTFQEVPEPGSLTLLAIGFTTAARRMRRRSR